MTKIKRNYPKVLLGYNENEPIYLDPPSWDCGWYWGFGYLGNKNCHYHIDGLTKVSKYNSDKKVFEYSFYDLKSGIDLHFGESYIIRQSDRWTIAELFKNFYDLQKTARLLEHGGSALTTSPCKNIIINKEEADRINETVLPSVFDEIYKIIERNLNNKKLFEKLVFIDNKGDTGKTLEFMNLNHMTPDDLIISNTNDYSNRVFLKGLNKEDYYRLHSAYWKDYHEKRK